MKDEKIIDAVETLMDAVDGISKKNDALTFSEFEKLFALAQDLVLVTASVYHIINKGDSVPVDIYSNVIKLHNDAVDFLEAIKEFEK